MWKFFDDRPSIYVADQETNYMLDAYIFVLQKCIMHHNKLSLKLHDQKQMIQLWTHELLVLSDTLMVEKKTS